MRASTSVLVFLNLCAARPNLHRGRQEVNQIVIAWRRTFRCAWSTLRRWCCCWWQARGSSGCCLCSSSSWWRTSRWTAVVPDRWCHWRTGRGQVANIRINGTGRGQRLTTTIRRCRQNTWRGRGYMAPGRIGDAAGTAAGWAWEWWCDICCWQLSCVRPDTLGSQLFSHSRQISRVRITESADTTAKVTATAIVNLPQLYIGRKWRRYMLHVIENHQFSTYVIGIKFTLLYCPTLTLPNGKYIFYLSIC